MKKLITYTWMFVACTISAQDMHFSQFNEHPSLVNPALSGATKRYRASLGYKNQWRKIGVPYKSFGVSLDGKLLRGSWKSADQLPVTHRQQNIGRIGGGLSVYRDKAGEGDMGLTQINLSLAGFIPTGRWSFLSVGLQGGPAFRRMDATTLVFPNQFDGVGYNADVNSGENIPLDRYRYFDFSSGVLWSYGYTEKGFIGSRQTRAKFGVACFHLTEPNLRVIGRRSENLHRKYVAHGDMLFSIQGSYVALNPSFIFQLQGPAMEVIAGMTVKYYTSDNTKFTGVNKSTVWNFGMYYRNADAIIMQLMLEYEEQFAFGFSYDLNISSLSKVSRYRGGLELMLRITPQDDFLYQKR